MNVWLVHIIFVLITAAGMAPAQVGSIPWTPKRASTLRQVAITVPDRYSSIALNPSLNFVRIPDGWTASIFAAGASFNKPRFMSWGPKQTLFVANMNGSNILALPDQDNDGVADTVIIAARGFSYGHDVRFWRDTMFVCQEAAIVKLWRSDTSTYIFDKRVTIIDKGAQANQIGGNHRTRTLVIDTVKMKLYVSVGSKGNADRELDRACIEEYGYDGSNRRIYASGVRNAVGMTLHPRTGKLWANNNGSDNQGNDIPPEWVDIVRDGGFYGYPIGYHYRNWYPFTGDYQDLRPFTAADSANMERMSSPAALVDAHCAPMALVFSESTATAEYRSGAFMAMRGSWNRTPPSGAKIVFLRFDDDADTVANEVEDFCTGFIRDTNNSATRWARPVGLALGHDGSVYVSLDDGKQSVLKLTPPRSSNVSEHFGSSVVAWPNPASNSVTVELFGTETQIAILDLQGRVVQTAVPDASARWMIVDVSGLAIGTYMLTLRGGSHVRSAPLQIDR